MEPNPLPIGQRIEAHYADQVHALPEPVQLLMHAAATDPSASPETIRRAAGVLGTGDDVEELATASGLPSMKPRCTSGQLRV